MNSTIMLGEFVEAMTRALPIGRVWFSTTHYAGLAGVEIYWVANAHWCYRQVCRWDEIVRGVRYADVVAADLRSKFEQFCRQEAKDIRPPG